jgi:hypothetical protein
LYLRPKNFGKCILKFKTRGKNGNSGGGEGKSHGGWEEKISLDWYGYWAFNSYLKSHMRFIFRTPQHYLNLIHTLGISNITPLAANSRGAKAGKKQFATEFAV